PEPLPQRILAIVASDPGLNTSELARRLDVSKRAAQNHVLDLLATGRLAHRRDGGARRLFLGVEEVIRATTPRETT
ncbi:MAG TPA: winged helix-turn-helix domain-containing protein, partial [Gemmatimonadaceae bacterium]